jgi:hypothetical protein
MAEQKYTNDEIDTMIDFMKNDPSLTPEKLARNIEIIESYRPKPKPDFEADIKAWSQDHKDGIQRHPKGPITEGADKSAIEAWAKRK